MRYTPLLAGTAAALAVRSTSDNIKCTDSLYVLVGRGTNEAAGPGVSGALADKIADKVKGTVVGSVDYPAKWSDPDYFVSESEGAKAVSDEIKQYTDKCPKAKIAYLGYSQGAQIGSDAICGNDNALFSSLAPFSMDLVEKYMVAGVVYGDPSHNITAPFNKGTAKTNGLFPRKDFSKCEKYADRFLSYCDAGDVYCASGNLTAVHGMYISKYGDEIVQYIVDHYNKATGTTPSGNSNATTTGSHGGSSATASPSGSQGTQSAGSSTGAKPTSSSPPSSAAAGLQVKAAYAAVPLAMLGAAMQFL